MKLLFLAPQVQASPLPQAFAAHTRDADGQPAGHDVRLAVPLAVGATGKALTTVAVPTVYGPQVAPVYASKQGQVIVYRIAQPRRTRGRPDLSPAEHTIFFSLAAVALCRALDWTPDVLHALDPAYSAAIYWLATDGLRDDFYGDLATALTVDDIDAPFVSAARALNTFGLTASDANDLPDVARDALPGLGMAYADDLYVDYAEGARSPAASPGAALVARRWSARPETVVYMRPRLYNADWDPARDRALHQPFDAEHLRRRAPNKRALQREAGLPLRASAQLFAVLTTGEAPADLAVLVAALGRLLARNTSAQLVGLGPAPAELTALTRLYPDRVAVMPRASDRLVRRLYAGADVFVASGRVVGKRLPIQPALRYGAVPVAADFTDDTDGLIDARQARLGNGFRVKDYNPHGLLQALQRAQRAWDRPERWRTLQGAGMGLAELMGGDLGTDSHLALYQQSIHMRKEKRKQLAGLLAEFPADSETPPGALAAAPLT